MSSSAATNLSSVRFTCQAGCTHCCDQDGFVYLSEEDLAKPTQCRTYPFWPELLKSESTWKRAGRSCPGVGKGPRIAIERALKVADEQRAAYPAQYPKDPAQ